MLKMCPQPVNLQILPFLLVFIFLDIGRNDMHVYGPRAFFRFLNIEFYILIFSQSAETRVNQARLMKKDFPAIRISNKSESSVADQFLYFSLMHLSLLYLTMMIA